MAVYDGFFDAVQDEETSEYDRTYGSEDFTRYFSEIIGSGVCVAYNPDSYKVTLSDGKALVNPGYIFINGYWQRIEDEPYSIDLPGTSPLAIAATLNTAKRMIELSAIPVADSYPADTLIIAIVDQSDATVRDTRYDTTICGVIDSMGGLSDKAAYALNYIDTQINTKLDQAEKEIREKGNEVDQSIDQVKKVVDKISLPPIGSIKFSAAHDMGVEWLKCDGRYVKKENYPELTNLLLGVPGAEANPDEINFYWSDYSSKLSLSSIAYGNGIFVGVGDDVAGYSLDGKEWVQTTIPSAHWADVTFGMGLFVAVSGGDYIDDSKVAYSTDGRNWFLSTLPKSAKWKSIAYGNGTFVALNRSYSAAYSTNGRSWSITTIINEGEHGTYTWNDVTFGMGLFVAVGSRNATRDTPALAIYSKDGITWETSDLPVDTTWVSVSYGDGIGFLAISTTRNAAISKDGKTWASIYTDESGLSSVVYGGGLFVATGGRQGNVSSCVFSKDGKNFYRATMPSYSTWGNIAYGNGSFIVSGLLLSTNEIAVCEPFSEVRLPDLSLSGVPAYIKAKETNQ